MSGDWAELIWEREVAGSNHAIPTIFRICHLLVGVILVASYCRPMSAGVAQRLRTLAPTSPPDRPTILAVEPVSRKILARPDRFGTAGRR
jgi:hypothetical protein